MITDILYATFEVRVSNARYPGSQDRHANARMNIETSREALDAIDAGNLLTSLLEAALASYDTTEEKDA